METLQTTPYDEIIYISQPIVGSHPNHLAATATLFGIDPPPLKNASILELGCGTGGNIIWQANSLPEASFLGIDLSLRQIEVGRAEAGKRGISNLELQQKSILEVDPKFGKFDYIICHGIFSWVPKEVRSKILEIFRNNLNPNGLAYLSYNVLPGWNLRKTIRDAMLFHIKEIVDPTERAKASKRMIGFLNSAIKSRDSDFNTAFRGELKLALGMPDWYLRHDFIAEINQAFYFSDFMELATTYNLQYLCDTEISTNIPQEFSAEVREALMKMSKDLISYEQYIDFLRNRAFRRSILCSSDISFQRKMNSDRVLSLRVASQLSIEGDQARLQAGDKRKFIAPNGGTIVSDDLALQIALIELKRIWPNSLSFSEISELVIKKLNIITGENKERIYKSLKQGFFSCFIGDLISFSVEPVRQ